MSVAILNLVADHILLNRISGVTVSMLASSAVDRVLEPRLVLTKDYKIGICCFSAKHADENEQRLVGLESE